MSIPDYLISAKVAALASVEIRAETDIICLLDNDTLLVNPVTIPDKPSELYLNFNPPAQVTRATVDGKSVWPYYNAGVVISRCESLGMQWLDLVVEMYSKHPAPFYTDQLALTLLASECDVYELLEEYNIHCTVASRHHQRHVSSTIVGQLSY